MKAKEPFDPSTLSPEEKKLLWKEIEKNATGSMEWSADSGESLDDFMKRLQTWLDKGSKEHV